MADRRGPSWLHLTDKARRELMISDPPPVLRKLAAQVEAHVPINAARAWLDGAREDLKKGRVSRCH